MTRKISALLACLAVLSAIFSACVEPPPDDPRVFRMSIGSDPQTFDPGMMSGSVEGRVAVQIFEGLLSPPPGDGAPEPGVAERYEVSTDRMRYTFHLRSNARWSNGDPVTAEDFRYAWMRQLRGDIASDYVTFVRYIRNARAYELAGQLLPRSRWGFALDLLERGVGVRVVDARTLVVELQEPTAYFLDVITFYTMMPVHRGTIERFGQQDAFRPENIVTNGPFRISEFGRRSFVRLVQNEYWWGRDQLQLDQVEMRIIEDLAAKATAFLDGRIDWADDLPHNQLGVLAGRDDFYVAPMLGTYYYRFNVTRPPFDDPRVRRAFALAINREEMCGCTLDGLYPPASMFVPPLPGYPERRLVEFNPDEARRLLVEAGYPGGEGLPVVTILYNTSENHRTIAQAVQDMWKVELGVDVQLLNQEWKVYLDAMEALDYQVARAGWIGDYVDANTFLSIWRSFDENNNTGWDNPEYDRIMALTLSETDPARRQALLVQAEDLLMRELPVFPLYFYSQFHLVAPTVRGWEMNIRDTHLLRYVSKVSQ